MVRLRKIVKAGCSYDLRFKPSDMDDLNYKVGEYLDVDKLGKSIKLGAKKK